MRSGAVLLAAVLAGAMLVSACGDETDEAGAGGSGAVGGASGEGGAGGEGDAGGPGGTGGVGGMGGLGGAGGAIDPCTDAGEACEASQVGTVRCSEAGTAACQAVDGCFVWAAQEASCASGTHCVAGACTVCEIGPGLYRNQAFESGGETRRYLLSVPRDFTCDATGAAILVDLHGSAGPNAEEAYGLQAMLDLSERENFVVVRPRSRFSVEGGFETYRWDQNPGDIERNAAFLRELMAELKTKLSIDPARSYVSGFSSGTNMASEFLGEQLFRGFGLVGGGAWHPLVLPLYGEDAPRIYNVTGYRDYMLDHEQTLRAYLAQREYPFDRYFLREVDTGHMLYAWHLEELWDWLDAGVRPDSGALAAGWSEESISADETLLSVIARDDGSFVASGAEGTLYARDPLGSWSALASHPDGTALTDLCVLPSGDGIAVGQRRNLRTADFGASWSVGAAVPELWQTIFGQSYLTAVTCGASELLGGGYWTSVASADGGATWTAANAIGSSNYHSQLAELAQSDVTGTSIAVGYFNYVGRRTAGAVHYTRVALSGYAQNVGWWNDVTVTTDGTIWIVGETGVLLRSTDDGASFSAVTSPTTIDLYAVDFFDDQHGMAVGRGGTALRTVDGGTTWNDVSVNVDRMLAGVIVLDATRALVVGEGGKALFFEGSP